MAHSLIHLLHFCPGCACRGREDIRQREVEYQEAFDNPFQVGPLGGAGLRPGRQASCAGHSVQAGVAVLTFPLSCRCR